MKAKFFTFFRISLLFMLIIPALAEAQNDEKT